MLFKAEGETMKSTKLIAAAALVTGAVALSGCAAVDEVHTAVADSKAGIKCHLFPSHCPAPVFDKGGFDKGEAPAAPHVSIFHHPAPQPTFTKSGS